MTERKTEIVIKQPKNKHELAAEIIQRELADGDIESKKIQAELTEYGIGEKTIQEVKGSLGIKSYMKMRKWYWSMNSANGGDQGHE